MTTHRSGSVKLNLYYYQLAGAEARERLLLAAAQRWGVPASELSARDSVITHAASGSTVRYGEVAARAAALEHPNPETITIKSAHEFSLMGTERRNLDVPPKVTGEAVYAIDREGAGHAARVRQGVPGVGAATSAATTSTPSGRCRACAPWCSFPSPIRG